MTIKKDGTRVGGDYLMTILTIRIDWVQRNERGWVWGHTLLLTSHPRAVAAMPPRGWDEPVVPIRHVVTPPDASTTPQPITTVLTPQLSEHDDGEPRCYVCMEAAGERDGTRTVLVSVCRCSESGAMAICRDCFVTWLECELERQGEFGAFRCMICKEPYRLRRARMPARIVCYVLGERVLTGLFFVSFFTGCVIVVYIMISLTALLSGHMSAYLLLVGGTDQVIFQAAEITLLFAFIIGSAAIVLTFLWHSFSPCGAPVSERRSVASVFDMRALDSLAWRQASRRPFGSAGVRRWRATRRPMLRSAEVAPEVPGADGPARARPAAPATP